MAQLVGWAVVEAIDAALMAALSRPPLPGQRADRALHYAYDAGLAVACGLASMGFVALTARLAGRMTRRGLQVARGAALLVAALAVGALVLREDLGGFASRSRFFGLPVLIAAFSLSVPSVAALAAAVRARSPKRRGPIALGAAGVLAAIANHLVVAGDYDGLHLLVSWCAAILVGAALSRPSVTSLGSSPPATSSARRPWLRRIALAVGLLLLATFASVSVGAAPPNGLRVDLVRARGGSLGPWMARVHRARGVQPIARAWFGDRDALKATPPSSPALLPSEPIVVLVTVDALRFDVVASGEHDDVLPNFARLRRESVQFTNARSVAPSTSASVASLFTGKYFSQLYWSPMSRTNSVISTHEDPSPRVPELLAAAGVATTSFIGLPGLANEYGLARGFKEEVFVPGQPYAMAKPIAERILARLRRHDHGPLFLWTHFSDPHAPYDEGGTTGTDFERYLREVTFVDAQLGRIADLLAAQFPKRAALIVSADHGEAFGEHQTRFHATTIYDELVHVPLLMRIPGVPPRVVTDAVSLIDLGPTLLDLLGAPTPGAFMGESLTPFLRGQRPPFTRPLVLESSRRKIGMVFPDGLKFIEDTGTGARELYDVDADPKELVNLADQRPAAAAECEGLLFGFHQEHELKRPGYKAPIVH